MGHDLLALSSRIIDEGITDIAVNRVTNELSELGDDLAIVESFSHCVALATDDGLVCFDASGAHTGRDVVAALRTWSGDRIRTLVYTHGHLDHVGGSGAFAADADEAGQPRPEVVGHEALPARLERYELTSGYNLVINARQFGAVRRELKLGIGGGTTGAPRFVPGDVLRPDRTVGDHHDLDAGGVRIELRHARGETDDHLWAWLPARRTIMAGDFVIWNFPNAGNPQKVQRYPVEWAAALREMAALDVDLLVPAHGLPIAGTARIRQVLDDVATALEELVADTLALMNEGQPLDLILHSVRVRPELLERPYLRPYYDEPEFVVRNVWRQFGGWYDGNPARLKPAPDAAVAVELARLAGGAGALAARGRELAAAGDLRLACHLVELAAAAAPDDADVHAARADVYEARRQAEPSLMAKGIFGAAARASLHATESANLAGDAQQTLS